MGPIRHIMTRIPGMNHCHDEPTAPSSSEPNRNRNSSGWPIENSSPTGSRRAGMASRVKTVAVSRRKVVIGEASPGKGQEHVVEGRAGGLGGHDLDAGRLQRAQVFGQGRGGVR